MLAGIAETTGTPLKKLVEIASEFAGFLKHADRDPTAVLETFTEQDTDLVLYVACHDFHRVAKGQPVELQVFEAWYFATAFEKVAPHLCSATDRSKMHQAVSRHSRGQPCGAATYRARATGKGEAQPGTSNGDLARSGFAERTALIPPLGEQPQWPHTPPGPRLRADARGRNGGVRPELECLTTGTPRPSSPLKSN